ncbi:MAG: hypothetical protein O3A56_09525 [Proteobacteria bacterium]|nr:hypothetical protein [Pseudomonadota bacterium]
MESYLISYGFSFFSSADLLSKPQLLSFMQGRDGWRIPIQDFHGPLYSGHPCGGALE